MRWIERPSPTGLPPRPDLHPLVSQALQRRGITSAPAAQAFLDPGAYTPAPGTDLPGLGRAAERVRGALEAGEPICIWGDFDVDGQTATTILFQALSRLDASVTYHIPVRSREGHGVNLPALEGIIEHGARLILTCDTGIGAGEAVEYAKQRGVDFVITDHHDLPAGLPQACAVTDPKLLPESHPLAGLSGSGVAYKLAEALLESLGHPAETEQLLDLAALGLVADLARLRGDSRYLVQRGLQALRDTQRLGLQVMMELAELVPANLTEEHIGFVLGPRLNALGRLGDANPAVEFLLTADPGRARLLATQLENYNAQRQLLTSQVTEAAEAQLRADPELLAQPVLVLLGPAWPGGVVGIAAARLVERYRKPAILLSAPGQVPAADAFVLRGSARSVEGLNITAAIAAQADLLLNYGGHPMAAGLALPHENLPEFRRRLARTVERTLGAAAREEPSLMIDGWLGLDEIGLDLASALEQLAPYGPGNEKLILATRDLTLQSAAPIGRGKEHLKLTVADSAGSSQQVLWWNGGSEDLPEGRFDLAYTVRASDWRGSRQVQMEFVAFRLKEEPAVQVRSGKPEIIDLRKENPQTVLQSLPPGTLLWAEAEEKLRVGGVDRSGLTRAPALAVWTIPPSPQELRLALEAVAPRVVYLIGAHPPAEATGAFTTRLMGLIKYAINHRGGQVSYDELMTATAQCRVTVERGLGWLIARGSIVLVREKQGLLTIAAGKTFPLPAGEGRLWAELQALLRETSAYRAHFRKAGKDELFP